MREPQRRRPHRLPDFAYCQAGRIFLVTVSTSPRRPIFSEPGLAYECIELLHAVVKKSGTRVYAYCLMPDHAHLLVEISLEVPLPAMIRSWKSLCYQARRRRGDAEKFWQRSFWDRGIRCEEDLVRAVQYVLANPVRAGLVDEAGEWPWSGSSLIG